MGKSIPVAAVAAESSWWGASIVLGAESAAIMLDSFWGVIARALLLFYRDGDPTEMASCLVLSVRDVGRGTGLRRTDGVGGTQMQSCYLE